MCLADVHRAVGFLQCASRFCVRAEDGYASGGTRRDIAACKHESETIDRSLQRRGLGSRVRLAQIPQQHREFVPAQPTDDIG